MSSICAVVVTFNRCDLLRRTLRAALWVSAHPWLVAGTVAGVGLLRGRLSRGSTGA